MSHTIKRLYGRLFLRGYIQTITGLHVGGSEPELAIGGVSNPVITNPITDQPYIPGSSLKGKMRSLLEMADGRPQEKNNGRNIYIHACEDKESYATCDVCKIYGVPNDPKEKFGEPTRLIVRDVGLTEASLDKLKQARTDLPFTEVKTEVTIDRITSAANPRTFERVPAGVEFGQFELVYNIYEPADAGRFMRVLNSMSLVEDDYLGGSGSRGSGKIKFARLSLTLKKSADYQNPITIIEQPEENAEELKNVGLATLFAEWDSKIKPRLEALVS